jgi:tripartite-type tricarboxylate transporter receptor subunit TctC
MKTRSHLRTCTNIMAGALLAAVCAWTAPAAHGQGPAATWPVKPIRIVLPFSGGNALVGRWLAQHLPPALGQQVVGDPRIGAGGNIGHEAVARAAPDGYTLLMGAPPVVINPHLTPGLSYDPLRDFASVALLATFPNVITVHPSVPAKSMRELIQLARNFPDKLSYGSGGVGSTNHLAAELLKVLTKTRILHVPYKGSTIALTYALNGEVDMVIGVASSALPYVRDGRMRALVTLDTKRVASMPGVPTSAEAGIPQLLAINWYVLLAPAATPRAIIDRLNAESTRIMRMPETREFFSAMGGEPTSNTIEQSTTFLREEFERWGKVIRSAGIKGE